MRIIIFISIILLFASLFGVVNRAQFIDVMITLYERGGQAELVACPFVDIDIEQHDAIVKAYGLGITAGTSATTFSPNDRVLPYQAFLFIGKTLNAIEKRNRQ